eukprot:s364_g7.t2
MEGIVCAWLRNDLRLHDNGVLHQAAAMASRKDLRVLPVYVFDPRYFQRTRYRTLRTGCFRALFLLQSRQLRRVGSDLLIKVGRPEKILPTLLAEDAHVLTQQEVTSAELTIDGNVRRALSGRCQWQYCWGSTLFHRDDVGCAASLDNVPEYFNQFVKCVWSGQVQKSEEQVDIPRVARLVRPCLPDLELGSLPLPEAHDLDFEPTWRDLPYAEELPEPYCDDEFLGGEEAGLERLSDYVWRTDFQYTYHTDRLEHFGEYYASRLGPWMAHGCLSPRKVFEEICRCEVHSPGLAHSQRLVVELTWRDFFRYLSGKHGNGIFREGGVKGYKRKWKQDVRMFNLWSEGRTGYPLVDACMRELQATGLASNHARLNAASFLACSMGFDWRRGADWFESHLLDYDVTSNWANWVRCAGLTEGRLSSFNVVRQSQKLDPDGVYLKRWLPELEQVDAPLIHEPWLMTSEEASVSGVESIVSPLSIVLVSKDLADTMDADPRSEEVKEHFTLRKLQERVWRLESENKELKVHNSILQTQYTSQYETNADILRSVGTQARSGQLSAEMKGWLGNRARHDIDVAPRPKAAGKGRFRYGDGQERRRHSEAEDTEGRVGGPAQRGPGVPKRQGEHGKGAVSRAEAKSTPRCDVSARKELASLKQQLEDNKEDFARKMSDYDRKKAVDMDILRQDPLDRLYVEQLDSTTKRTIMENEQMFTELHFQSKETEKLMERNQSLLEENAQLRRNLLIHKDSTRLDLENELARRTHLYQRLLKKMDQKLKSEAAQQEQSREFNPAKSTESAIPEQDQESSDALPHMFSGLCKRSAAATSHECRRASRWVVLGRCLEAIRTVLASQWRRSVACRGKWRITRARCRWCGMSSRNIGATMQLLPSYRTNHNDNRLASDDQSTRLIISALYELKQQKEAWEGFSSCRRSSSGAKLLSLEDQAPFPPTSYDPDAEWQFTNMTPKQKEYFFRVLLEKLNSSMCAMCFPVGPQATATSTASLPAIGKTEQGGKEGMRFSQFLWSVATDDGPSQGLRQEMCTKACQTETSTADPCLKERPQGTLKWIDPR